MKQKKILFIGGKGGVGKSTTASALAYFFAQSNQKTLLISTDPAHNLSDIFETKLSNQIKNLDDNLFALEIDPKEEIKFYLEKVAKDTRSFVSANSYSMVDNYYKSLQDSPMAQESALFDRLITLIVTEFSIWDKIIIDTAPTGHTLRLFTLPKTLRDWSKTLLTQQERNGKIEGILGHLNEENSLQERLQKRYEIYTKFNTILQNKNLSTILFVLNPEYLSIEETKRALHILNDYKININSLIINKIMPSDSSDPFFQKRAEIQQKYLENIEKDFKAYKLWKIPLKNHDIRGKDMLALIRDDLTHYL